MNEEQHFSPVRIDLNGKSVLCEYGKTEVHLFKNPEDRVYNHFEVLEYGTQRVFGFDCIRHLMYLGGLILPGNGLSKPDEALLSRSMYQDFGWEARVTVERAASEELKERYIRIGTKVLRAANVYVPQSW